LKPCGGSKKRVHGRFRLALIVLGSLFVGALLVLALACILLKSRDQKKKSEESVSTMFEGSSSKLNEVIEATENFDDKYIIGTGAHGTVYKATLRSGDVYAIKKLVILYDFMDKGSLHDVLHVIQPAPVLDWCVRYEIALGTAHGLAYLHDDCRPPIIHRDIKPSNILLDKDMVPHISDFGIAKLMDQPSAPQTTGIVGTVGYMAPELAFSTKSSMESDVYSYGVVLLELLTRKTAVDPSFPDSTDIVGWVSSALSGTDKIEAICDPALMEEVYGTVEMEEVRKVLSLALRCAAREASQRPSMAAVVKELTDVRPAAGRSLSKKQGKPGPGSQSHSSSY